MKIVPAFAGCGAQCGPRIAAAEDAVEVELWRAREGESKEGAAEDKPEDKVVALGEADWVVNLAE